jgi:hypothetical protein
MARYARNESALQWTALTRKAGNILPDSSAAPGIQGQQRDLQKHMRANSLEKQLQARPRQEDLVKGGILRSDETAVADS